jgi:hypothetical protein
MTISMAKKEIFQIKIFLKRSKPKIWRRILVPSDMKLFDLHKVLQTTMGWTNSHLHQFIKDGVYYTEKMADDDFWDDAMSVDYKKMKVSSLLDYVKDKMMYEYDFGDGWEHEILLEKVLPFDKNLLLPVCLDGRMNCPPEDCGGTWGYENMLEILNQPEHPEYKDTKEWLSEDFDPGHFSIDEVNQGLSSVDYGVFSWR